MYTKSLTGPTGVDAALGQSFPGGVSSTRPYILSIGTCLCSLSFRNQKSNQVHHVFTSSGLGSGRGNAYVC
jgi:hypothetical protein